MFQEAEEQRQRFLQSLVESQKKYRRRGAGKGTGNFLKFAKVFTEDSE